MKHPFLFQGNATVFRRSHVTASDSAPSIWGVQEYIAKRPNLDLLILMQTTSPFTRISHIRSALEKINTPVAYDCVFTVTR